MGTGLENADFTVLALKLPATPPLSRSATHYMYLRQHQPKVSDPTTARSLFIVNIPFDSTVDHLKHVLGPQLGLPTGRIAHIDIVDRHETQIDAPAIVPAAQDTTSNRKRKREQDIIEALPPLDPSLPDVWDRKLYHPGTNAIATFVDKVSMDVTLKAVRASAKSGKEIIWGDGVEDQAPSLGSARYKRHAKLLYPGTETLNKIAEDYLVAFDAHTAARDRLLAERRNEPDEDGFVTVTGSAGRNGMRGVKQDAAKERLEKQKKKQEGLGDFYRFQGRDKAKQRARELISKFQDDVEKAKRLRERRGRSRIQ